MTQIVFSSNQNGTGVFTVETPATNTNRVITLPDVNGSLLVDSQIATEAEAIAGTDNTKIMTALRVAQTVVAVPSGGIILWSGSVASIPAGWALCDGTNGTPNLRDRFVVGAGSTYAVGATGGASTVTLTTAQLPSHSHTLSSGAVDAGGSHFHISGYGIYTNGDSGRYGNIDTGIGATRHDLIAGPEGRSPATSTAANHTHTLSGSTGAAGSGSAHENMPPYYALCYIMNL